MGRKRDVLGERPKTGPGRKSKKQGEPVLSHIIGSKKPGNIDSLQLSIPGIFDRDWDTDNSP